MYGSQDRVLCVKGIDLDEVRFGPGRVIWVDRIDDVFFVDFFSGYGELTTA
jgi:hypothetical protein